MVKIKLTKRVVEAANPGERDVILWDINPRGFGCKITPTGHCDLCGQAAPFETVDGPYFECHHVSQLAKAGPDTTEDAVAHALVAII